MKLLPVLMLLMLFPVVYALKECKPVIEPEEIPCQITTTWKYSPSCQSQNVSVYRSNGSLLLNTSFTNYLETGYCHFNWTTTDLDSYMFTTSNGDSGIVIVEATELMLSIIIGVAVICALFLWLAFNLDKEHLILKLFLIFETVALLSIIPSTFILSDTSVVLHKAYVRFMWVFWLYVGVYYFYRVMVWLGILIPSEGNQ